MDEVRLWDKLDKMDEKLDGVAKWQGAMDERCQAHRTQTDEIRSTLYSNPHGLVEQVGKLVSCKTNISRWRDFLIFILRYLLAAGIIGLAAWLLAIYKGA